MSSAALLLTLSPPGAAQSRPTSAGDGPVAGAPVSYSPNRLRRPFVEYEAEDLVHSGTVIGPDRAFGTLAAEASGRRAVRLQGASQSVSVRLRSPVNALTVRYAIADSPDGTGLDATIGVYAAARRIATLPVTSRYGWFYGAYPFTNRPGDGRAHHFFDHGRMLLDRELPAGTVLSIRLDPTAQVDRIAIDLIDVERAPPPLRRPPRAVSLVDFGADATGGSDSSDAFRRAIAAARTARRPLWIPPGRFRVDGHFTVDQVEIAGAGQWRSTLFGHKPGLYGLDNGRQSTGVHLHDFAILSDVTERIDNDQVNAIGGAMGGGSRIERLWLQHAKVGLWFDGPMDGIVISDVRILDMTADGLNFHRSVSNATVQRSFVRGTGDDGLASWAGGGQNRRIAFRDNVIVAPVLANGIAIYGGEEVTVQGNVIADTLQGGGIHIGNRFDAVPVAGTIRIADNIVIRSGSYDANWRIGLGAFWLFALDAPISARILVDDLRLVDSTYDAVLFMGSSVGDVRFDRLTVDRAGGPLITARSSGQATIANLSSRGIAIVQRLCATGFDLTLPGSAIVSASVDRTCGPVAP